jgi:hypothetical protein
MRHASLSRMDHVDVGVPARVMRRRVASVAEGDVGVVPAQAQKGDNVVYDQ